MPISAIADCSESHWVEVREIIADSIAPYGFKADLVSSANEAGIIQKQIVQNLYQNEIVVCDVSCKNPNVMFELGIRLTFDRPTVVIKDDKTDYSFDTSPIEHLVYPRDLRFSKIVKFQKFLGDKVRATHKMGADPKYSTFLKHFGEFVVPRLETKEVSQNEFILKQLQELRDAMIALSNQNSIPQTRRIASPDADALQDIAYDALTFAKKNGQPFTIDDFFSFLRRRFPDTPIRASKIHAAMEMATSRMRAEAPSENPDDPFSAAGPDTVKVTF